MLIGRYIRQTAKAGTPLSLADASRLVARLVDAYNHARPHNAIGYITPASYACRHRATEARDVPTAQAAAAGFMP